MFKKAKKQTHVSLVLSRKAMRLNKQQDGSQISAYEILPPKALRAVCRANIPRLHDSMLQTCSLKNGAGRYLIARDFWRRQSLVS